MSDINGVDGDEIFLGQTEGSSISSTLLRTHIFNPSHSPLLGTL